MSGEQQRPMDGIYDEQEWRMSGSYEVRRAQAKILALVVVISAVIALPALLMSWLLRRAMQRNSGRVLMVVVLFTGIAGLYMLRERLWFTLQDLVWALVDVDTESILSNLMWLWLATFPAAPVLALFVEATRRRNPEHEELEAIKRRTAAKERRRDRARQKARRAPE